MITVLKNATGIYIIKHASSTFAKKKTILKTPHASIYICTRKPQGT